MKKSFAITAGVLALTAAAFAAEEATVSKSYDLAGFDRIDISGVYEFDVKVGPGFSVMLSGNQAEIDHAKVGVEEGVLTLGHEKWKRGEKRFNGNRDGLKATITLPALNGLDLSGVGDGDVEGVDADAFSVDVSGVGDLRIGGKCKSLDADVSGVGDLNAKSLECNAVDVEVSGVGSAVVYASDEVRAEVSGMGDIDVYGSPAKVSKNKSMFADVTVH
ncbi:MAG: head GIN domain-containing protein [Parvularculaceae bacterium]